MEQLIKQVNIYYQANGTYPIVNISGTFFKANQDAVLELGEKVILAVFPMQEKDWVLKQKPSKP